MMELTAEDAAIEELVTHPFLSLSLDAALSQLALQHVDVIAHDVVAADKPVDLSLLRNVTERLAAHEEWTKDHDKIATRIVKEFSRTIARAVSASMMRGENVKLFVHLDENLAPLLAFIAAVSEKAKTSSATELMRWTPFVVHASAFFCCGQLPAYEAMRCTELATRVLDTCQRLHQSSCRAELLALVFERLVALTSQDVSKDGWTSDHSIAKHVLEWVVLQVAFPHFGGDALGRVLALVFPLVDDLTDATQLVGARMLLHIAKNVTDTELRWYTDVLLEVLRGAITTRKPVTLDCLVETLVVSLEKLSPPGDFQYYDRFVPRLLNDCRLSSDVALRVLYTRHFRAVATRLGAPHSIYLIRFLQPLLKVLVASFESVNASLVIETLTTLRLVVISAWPRIPAHSEEILVGVLKAVALCEAFQGTEPHLPTTAERTEILRLSEEIVALLMKLSSSSVTVMLQRVADESHALKPFASRALTAE